MRELDLRTLQQAVSGTAAAFRCRTRLQPAGGPGDKVFPPTFAGAVYAVEQRQIRVGENGNGEPEFQARTCVLLDSVQSQANRMEEALQEAVDADRISIPVITVDFSDFFPGDDVDEQLRLLDPIGRVTSLEAPHRIADAILRDSEHDGEPFRDSELGKAIDLASVRNATPLFELCPTSLVFGVWDSTGPKGGLGAKFERSLVSEIVGVGSPYRFTDGEQNPPRKRGIRRDPLGISKNAMVRKTSEGTWQNLDNAKAEGAIRPSEINHGNVPFPKSGTAANDGGVTIDYAEQTTVLSLAALRRLKFPLSHDDWQATDNQRAKDAAARTVLAALGICAAELAAEAGMDLRSRCLLWPDVPRSWELLDKPGEEPQQFTLDGQAAVKLLQEAVEAAESAGVTWHSEPITLSPSDQLAKLVVKSQQLAAVEGGEE